MPSSLIVVIESMLSSNWLAPLKMLSMNLKITSVDLRSVLFQCAKIAHFKTQFLTHAMSLSLQGAIHPIPIASMQFSTQALH